MKTVRNESETFAKGQKIKLFQVLPDIFPLGVPFKHIHANVGISSNYLMYILDNSKFQFWEKLRTLLFIVLQNIIFQGFPDFTKN